MKIFVNAKEVLELSETQKKVLKDEIQEDIFIQDMERRVNWILTHKYEECFRKLKDQWEPKLKSRYDSIPTNPEALAELIFSQPDYRSRSQRDKEEELANRRQ